jgi:hypothetical protein
VVTSARTLLIGLGHSTQGAPGRRHKSPGGLGSSRLHSALDNTDNTTPLHIHSSNYCSHCSVPHDCVLMPSRLSDKPER